MEAHPNIVLLGVLYEVRRNFFHVEDTAFRPRIRG